MYDVDLQNASMASGIVLKCAMPFAMAILHDLHTREGYESVSISLAVAQTLPKNFRSEGGVFASERGQVIMVLSSRLVHRSTKCHNHFGGEFHSNSRTK